MNCIKFIFISFALSMTANAELLGYDYDLWDYVEFGDRCFREGDAQFIYDNDAGDIRLVEIDDIQCKRKGCSIILYDYEDEEWRDIELEEDMSCRRRR